MLSKLFSKKEPVEKKEEPKSIFSTHVLDGSRTSKFGLMKLMNQSLQRTASDERLAVQGTMDNATGGAALAKINGSLQYGINDALFGWYLSQGFIGHQACAMIAQNWLINKACQMPAEDAVRNGWDITVNDGKDLDPEELDKISYLDTKYKIRKNLVEAEKFNNIFGIRVIMFKVDGIDYEKPFNIDGVKKGAYKGISQIDPYWMTPEFKGEDLSDPTQINFYEPEYWVIGSQRVHRSHLVVLKGDEVPDILKPTYLYGGISVPQKIMERVYASERTANEAPMLAMTKRLNYLKIDTSSGIANQAQLEQKIQNWVALRDNHGVKVISTEEDVGQEDTSLTDVDTTIMTQYQIVAAGAEVPATKLLGTSPKGFNATGEHETKSYHEKLESIQEDLTAIVSRHYELLVKSELEKDFNIVINWCPVDSPSASEMADIELKKSQSAYNYAQSGAVDGQDIRDKLIKDKDSGYDGMEEEAPEMPDVFGEEEMLNV